MFPSFPTVLFGQVCSQVFAKNRCCGIYEWRWKIGLLFFAEISRVSLSRFISCPKQYDQVKGALLS